MLHEPFVFAGDKGIHQILGRIGKSDIDPFVIVQSGNAAAFRIVDRTVHRSVQHVRQIVLARAPRENDHYRKNRTSSMPSGIRAYLIQCGTLLKTSYHRLRRLDELGNMA